MEGVPLEFERPIGDEISRIRFSPRSNNLLISSWDSTLRLYDVDDFVLRMEATSVGAGLLDCCFEDESGAFTVDSEGCVRRYDLHKGIHDIVGQHGQAACCIEHSEETGLIITADIDRNVIPWGKCMASVSHSHIVDMGVGSMSLCGLFLALATGRTVNVLDLRNLNRPVQSNDSSMDYHITCVRSFPNSQGYVVGSVDGRVRLRFFDLLNACEASMCIFRCHPKKIDGDRHLVAVNDIAFHPCNNTFVTGDDEGYAIIWDNSSRKRLLELPKYTRSIGSMSYNHNGQLLAIASGYPDQEASKVLVLSRVFYLCIYHYLLALLTWHHHK
ncbi:Rae1-like protein [Acorus gramineus]|uniref:Rae1-like protein n=1 Tax=Acorus gramineus TaxID=55184 RepID=A0AAV9B3T4_ACOGR|nr:Rae1-like protein [Acorus gramineus]